MDKHFCIIDSKGYYKDFASLVDPLGNRLDDPYGRIMAEGETLLDAPVPENRLKPRWNGTAWEETATAEELEAADTRTLAEAQEAKLAQLTADCRDAIVAGCDVKLSDGTVEHFALDETDQINITTAVGVVSQGAEGYPYHADTTRFRMYPAVDILSIGKEADAHILYHTIYHNHLKEWVKRMETKQEVDLVYYGVQLPDDLKTNMEGLLSAAGK